MFDFDENILALRDIMIHQTTCEFSSSWPLYGQWSRRSATDDDSPDMPRQSDGHNCGVILVTNAFCLAFGYDLLCYSQNDLDDLKRPRMASELSNGGFGGPGKYDYPLLDLPGNSYTLFDKGMRASEYYTNRGIEDPQSRRPRKSSVYHPPPFIPRDVDPMDIAHPMDDIMEGEGEQRAFVPGKNINTKTSAQLKGLKKLRTPKQLDEVELSEYLSKISGHKDCQRHARNRDSVNVRSSEMHTNWESGVSDDESSGPDDDPESVENEPDEESTLEPIHTSNERFVAARRLLDGSDGYYKTAYLKILKGNGRSSLGWYNSTRDFTRKQVSYTQILSPCLQEAARFLHRRRNISEMRVEDFLSKASGGGKKNQDMLQGYGLSLR